MSEPVGAGRGRLARQMSDPIATGAAPGNGHDELDRRLISALRQNPRAGLAELGGAIGLSADAARKRLRRLDMAGAIRVVGRVDPGIFGLGSFALVGVQVTGPTRTVLDELKDVEAINYVVTTAGPFDLFVELVAHDDRELNDLIDQHVRAVPGVLHSEVFLYLDVVKWIGRPSSLVSADERHGSRRASFDQLDLQLLAVLQRDGRASYRELADATRVNYSTARRRVQALLASDVVELVTEVNDVALGDRAISGVGLRFEDDPRKVLAEVAEAPDVTAAVLTSGRYHALLEIGTADRQTLSERLREIAVQPGVRSLTSFPYLGVPLLSYAWDMS